MSSKAKSLSARIAAKVINDPASGCRIWTGALSSQGRYPTVAAGGGSGKVLYVHQVMAGPAPEGSPPDGSHRYEVHHLCFRRSCVNPDHLTWLTHRQHMAIHAVVREAEKSGEVA